MPDGRGDGDVEMEEPVRAKHLGDYNNFETNRFSGYFDRMPDVPGVMLTSASRTTEQ